MTTFCFIKHKCSFTIPAENGAPSGNDDDAGNDADAERDDGAGRDDAGGDVDAYSQVCLLFSNLSIFIHFNTMWI